MIRTADLHATDGHARHWSHIDDVVALVVAVPAAHPTEQALRGIRDSLRP